MESKINQSKDLSDYSKFNEDKENMVELFFDIFKNLKINNNSNDPPAINYSKSADSLINSTFNSSTLDSSDSLSLDSSAINYEIYDLHQEPVVEFLFDENQIYKDYTNDLLVKPINLPSTLTKTYNSIEDQALEMGNLYNRIRNKIIDFKNQDNDFIKCISALNRIVIQLDQNLPKLCLLSKLSNLKLNIKEYKEYLSKYQSTTSTNSIQQMIDLFYTSYLEFDNIIRNSKTIDELINYSNKLQSNLEYLRSVYSEYKKLKKGIQSEFRKLKSSIKLLRYNIVKDLIEVIKQLSSDECNQLFTGFTQYNLIVSFKRLLKTIS